MNVTAAELRELLDANRPVPPAVGYPLWLRERVGAYVLRQRAAGMTLAAMQHALGVSNTTLSTWSQLAAPRSFAPVVVHDALPQHIGDEPAPALLTLTSPSGYVLAGLRLSDAAALLQTLR